METPPGFYFIYGFGGLLNDNDSNTIWKLESIQVNAEGKLTFKINSIDWFNSDLCSYDAVTESSRSQTFYENFGMTFSSFSGFWTDWEEDLIGYKRNEIVGDISPINCDLLNSTFGLNNSTIQLFIYPNPAAETISFLLDKEIIEPVKIELYNSNGQTIFEKKQSIHNSLNISNLPIGFYFVKISSSFGHTILKFVKS